MLDRNDIFYFDKLKVIEVLSLKDDIIFVGGTSEYLQGLKNNLNDIDITITDINCLKDIGYIHRFYQNIFFNHRINSFTFEIIINNIIRFLIFYKNIN